VCVARGDLIDRSKAFFLFGKCCGVYGEDCAGNYLLSLWFCRWRENQKGVKSGLF
jgi:hypothetical protein